ncbi:hypothetical protein EDC01DRAFT_63885 [Geopyxis carbonaria]|nr:hypothetical protein EDC01DRAFT_63885 [Geopyxis carbonaria]
MLDYTTITTTAALLSLYILAVDMVTIDLIHKTAVAEYIYLESHAWPARAGRVGYRRRWGLALVLWLDGWPVGSREGGAQKISSLRRAVSIFLRDTAIASSCAIDCNGSCPVLSCPSRPILSSSHLVFSCPIFLFFSCLFVPKQSGRSSQFLSFSPFPTVSLFLFFYVALQLCRCTQVGIKFGASTTAVGSASSRGCVC